ncbi:fimbrial protein [Acinetobacter sp.]|uniref:fimbrial protein n=1 Tax=Acinetobacter sp. TaxID=472 RepID=UPI0031D42C03
MKMQILTGVMVILGAAQIANAADTITFTGTIDSNTCTVDVGGTTSSTITLPNVGAGSLTAAGKTAGATPFSINIKGCGTTADDVAVRFVAHNPDDTNLGLDSSSTAANVSIQLLKGSAGSSSLDFTNGVAETDKQTTASGTATYNMTAQYYAKGAVTAGTVMAVTDYEVIYP